MLLHLLVILLERVHLNEWKCAIAMAMGNGIYLCAQNSNMQIGLGKSVVSMTSSDSDSDILI